MIINRLTAFLFLIGPMSFAQFSDDFSSGSIAKYSIWKGDTSCFHVNAQQQLQSKGPAVAAKPLLYMASNALSQAEWSCWIRLDFEPSASNHAKIFLAASSVDTSDPGLEAYYLKVGGMSGNKDAFDLYYQKGSSQTLVVKGIEGHASGQRVTARIKVKRDETGYWQVYSDSLGGENFLLEGSGVHTALFNVQVFGIQCIYTSTRSRDFYVDDVRITGIRADRQAPTLLMSKYNSLFNGWELLFDETLNAASPALVRRQDDTSVAVPVVFLSSTRVLVDAKALGAKEGQGLEVTIEQVMDLAGNSTLQQARLAWPRAVYTGTVFINEVLVDPFPYGVDFVELYNASSEYIEMKEVVLRNQDNELGNCPDLVLPPGTYRVLTKDSMAVKQFYPYAAKGSFVFCDLPSLPDDAGSLSVEVKPDTIDFIRYTASMHHPLLQEKEGISLERTSILLSSSHDSNWQSASTTSGGATPGYVNSQAGSLSSGGGLSIEPRSISPGTDGYRNCARIHYALPKPGGALRIDVFSLQGHWICALQPNGPADLQGYCVWNGTNASLQPVSTGLYLVIAEFTHPEGDHIKMKGTVSVLLR